MSNGISLDEKLVQQLVAAASTAMKASYSPYSKFPVGSAVLCADNSIVTGCNVENASIGLTICAERTALVKTVSQGHLKIKGLAVASMAKDFISPCGMCRQTIREFCDDPKSCFVILTKPDGSFLIKSLEELLPYSFGPESLLREKERDVAMRTTNGV